MSTYYIDSNATYEANHANNGTASATPWGGAGGVQRALGVVAAGETINIKTGTAIDLTKLVKVVCTGTLVGTLAVDDFVYCFEFAAATPTVAEAGGGQGYVVYITGKTYWIAVTAGSWTTGAAHCITKENAAVFSNYIEAITVTKPGLTTLVTGTIGSRISIIGTDSSWNNDHTTLTTLDGMNTSTGAVNGLLLDYTKNYYTVENLFATRATGIGIRIGTTSGGGTFCTLLNCSASGNGTHGIGLYSGSTMLSRCASYVNTAGHGFYCYGVAQFCFFCVAYNNGLSGFSWDYSGGSFLNCISHGNTQNGFVFGNYSEFLLSGCISDGNTRNGILFSSDSNLSFGRILGCRITNNSVGSSTYYGLNAVTAGVILFNDFNVMYNNSNNASPGTQHYLNVTAGPNSLTAASTTEQGYTDAANHDFNLTTAAILRNTALELQAVS
jgi:hypothetical protein